MKLDIEIVIVILLVIGIGNGVRVRFKNKQDEEDYRNKLLFMLSLDGKQSIKSYIDNKNNNTNIIIDNATIINTFDDTTNQNKANVNNTIQNVTEPHLLYPVITNSKTSVISSSKVNIDTSKKNTQLSPLTIIPIITHITSDNNILYINGR